MMALEDLKTRQEEKDSKRDHIITELRVQWFNYSPQKRVSLIKQFPEIAERILCLIESK